MARYLTEAVVPGVVGDVGINGDRIVAVGDINGTGVRTIDASGLYVTPGFIDMHSHSETYRLLNGGQGPSFAFQGFTTEIYGETESMGPLGGLQLNELPDELLGKWESFGEFLDYMEEVGISINVASYVGSGGLRAMVMGYDDRPPTDDELEQMLELVRKSMREGALGVSAGMSYVPNVYMTTDELAAIVGAGANMGGIFANHARTMNGTDSDAIREAIAVGEQAGAAIHFFPSQFDIIDRSGHIPRHNRRSTRTRIKGNRRQLHIHLGHHRAAGLHSSLGT